MRKPIIAGNWKLNGDLILANDLVNHILDQDHFEDREIVLCPPFVYISKVVNLVCKSKIKVGAQDVYWKQNGAFTGEVSAAMLKDIGASYVIIGHSERRQFFHESDEDINLKIKAALDQKLIPIICVGESLAERESEKTETIVLNQIEKAFNEITREQATLCVIAYEPIWAIGTGLTATPEQAQEVHLWIRNKLTKLYSEAIASQIRILYGGSVKPDNVDSIMSQSDVDGALVGGASLDADSFNRIINFKNIELTSK